MFSISLNFKSAPLNSDGNDGSDLLRSKRSDNYVGAVVGIFGFDLDVEVGLGIYVYFSYVFGGGLLFLVLAEPTLDEIHFLIINIEASEYGFILSAFNQRQLNLYQNYV